MHRRGRRVERAELWSTHKAQYLPSHVNIFGSDIASPTPAIIVPLFLTHCVQHPRLPKSS